MLSARKKKKNKINLLPQEEFDSTVLGRVLAWMLSGFRIIVIAVEVIVMIAFLSRFWFDAKNSDLSDEIKQKEAQILASSSFEKDFRNTQKKLKIFSDATSNEGKISTYLNAIPKAMPNDVFLVSSSIDKDGATINGLALSEQSVAQFMVNLESLEVFDHVELVSVDTNPGNQSLIAFSLTLTSGARDSSALSLNN